MQHPISTIDRHSMRQHSHYWKKEILGRKRSPSLLYACFTDTVFISLETLKVLESVSKFPKGCCPCRCSYTVSQDALLIVSDEYIKRDLLYLKAFIVLNSKPSSTTQFKLMVKTVVPAKYTIASTTHLVYAVTKLIKDANHEHWVQINLLSYKLNQWWAV